MRKSISLILFLIFICPILTFSQTGNEEFRATWVITWNYSSSSFSVETSQQRIREVLDNHVKANMNAVLFQVRQSGTAYYQSSFEPWGSYSPQYTDYDPLTFAIEEAHKRGLELHAWFNCFAAASTVSGSPAAEHPEWVCRDRDGISMDSHRALSPGLKAVRDYTVDVAMEIVNNYDIDGLHMDYVRWNEYSNSKKSKSFAASIDENRMFDGYITDEQIEDLIENKGGRYLYDIDHPYSAGIPNDIPGETFSSWEDYWRWSVTEFVQTLHDSIQSIKPWVRLSAAALGKYRWSSWQGYGTVYQDAALWFNGGYVDQLTPMHYHWTSGSSFYDMLNGGHSSSWGYWIQPGIDAGRLFSAGPGSYILLENKIWYRHKEIIQACRNIDWVDGFQFFSYGSWNGAKYWDEAGETVFKKMIKIRSNVQSGIPTEPTVSLLKNDPLKYEITVTPDAGISENHWFLVYRSEDETINPDEDEIIDIHFGQESYTITDSFPGTQNFNGKYHYATTCLDRYWSESVISNDVISDSIPSYAPIVLKTIPTDGDTIPVNTSIIFYLSKSIDTTNFISNITINPGIPLSGFSWTDDNSTVKFLTSGALNFDTQYTINLHPTLTDVNGKALDGNADGIPGDGYAITFRTFDVDVSGPTILASYPDVNTEKFDLDDVITIEFDELVDPETINGNTVSLINDGNPVTIEAIVNTFENRSILNVKPFSQLISDAVNVLTLSTGITDTLGNALSNEIKIDFTTDNYYYSSKKMVDDFNETNNWWDPEGSGSTTGTIDYKTIFGYSTLNYLPASAFNESDQKSAYIKYEWDPDAQEHLLREHCAGGPADINIDTTYIFQCYVYGDGSNNKFRFSLYETGAQIAEVSNWITIDWVGWRLLEWDLGDPNSVGDWIGNGIMDGTSYHLDGIHLTKGLNGSISGIIYIDNLRLVKRTSGPASPNTAPFLEDLPDTSTTEGSYVKIYPTWEDPDESDVHEIICISDTADVLFRIMGHTSGSKIYVRPQAGFTGVANIMVIVKDYGVGELSDTTQFILTVYPDESVDSDIIPVLFSLAQNYPNPFNPTTTIRFSLDNSGSTRLIIYDILGRKVTELVNQHLQAGNYTIRFDASNLPSGQYLYQLISGRKVLTKKMMLLK